MQESAPVFGSQWLIAFASFVPDTSSSKTSQDLPQRWVPVQESLLSELSSPTWPKQGTWDLGFAYELPTSEPPTSESESSLLLPTPNAYESTPAEGYVDEVRQSLEDPHKRLYLPGRKWHTQRTLSRMAPALLPTPSANDSTGAEGPTRSARQEKGTGGPSLRDLPHLLPTPSATQNDGHDPDKFLARRERELAKGQNGNGFGLTLGMAVQLLPTPTSSYRGDRSEASKETGGGNELRAIRKLLPTPTVGDAHSSGSRKLEGSKAHPGTSLTDAIVREKLLPTPTVNDARNTGGRSQEDRRSLPMVEIARDVSGGSTPRPSYVGKSASESPHPDQLTIEDV